MSNKKGRIKRTSKNDLLDEQLKAQTSLYTEWSQSLAEIKMSAHKNCQLKEGKLKMYKKLLESKKEKLELCEEELKCKKEHRTWKIEIEKRRIELEEKNGNQND